MDQPPAEATRDHLPAPPLAVRSIARVALQVLLWAAVVAGAFRYDQRFEIIWNRYTQTVFAAYFLAYLLTELLKLYYIVAALVVLKLSDRRLPAYYWNTALWVMLSQMLVNGLLKRLFGRLRPEDCDGVTLFQGPTISEASFSFPSGHASAAFSLASLFSSYYPRWRALFLAVAVVFSLARIQMDRHFLSDVIVGGLLGWYWTKGVLWVLRRRRDRAAATASPQKPGDGLQQDPREDRLG